MISQLKFVVGLPVRSNTVFIGRHNQLHPGGSLRQCTSSFKRMASRLVHWGWPQKVSDPMEFQWTKMEATTNHKAIPESIPRWGPSSVTNSDMQRIYTFLTATTPSISTACNSWCGNFWFPPASNLLKSTTLELPSRAGCSNMSKNQGWAHLNHFVLDTFHRFGGREPKAALPAIRPRTYKVIVF